MALEALKEIEEIEKQAEEKIAAARIAAKRMVDDAQDAAAAMQAVMHEEIRELTLKFTKEQQECATKMIEEGKKTAVQAAQIQHAAQEKMQEAVADIIERVVNA